MAGKEIWDVVLAKPAEKAYDRSPADMKARLADCFDALEQNPVSGGNIKQLTGQLKGLNRYRVGDWRVIYRIHRERRAVEIIAILPRGDAC